MRIKLLAMIGAAVVACASGSGAGAADVDPAARLRRSRAAGGAARRPVVVASGSRRPERRKPVEAAPGTAVSAPGGSEDQVAESDALSTADVADTEDTAPPAQELPETARRDPNLVGRLDPAAIGLGADPFSSASGPFLRAGDATDGGPSALALGSYRPA